MHTPAKGAGPNKGLGGSNPPFSAISPFSTPFGQTRSTSPKTLVFIGFQPYNFIASI